MSKNQVEMEVYVGMVSNSANGAWVKLPMQTEMLENRVDLFQFGDAEYGILDVQSNMLIDLSQHCNVFALNEALKVLKEYEDRGEFMLIATAYNYCNYDLDDAIKFLERGNYSYYEDVTSLVSLGEAVVRNGEIGLIFGDSEESIESTEVKQMEKENLLKFELVKSYLDFEKIGIDWNCNGCIIYPKLKTAMMEVRPN